MPSQTDVSLNDILRVNDRPWLAAPLSVSARARLDGHDNFVVGSDGYVDPSRVYATVPGGVPCFFDCGETYATYAKATFHMAIKDDQREHWREYGLLSRPFHKTKRTACISTQDPQHKRCAFEKYFPAASPPTKCQAPPASGSAFSKHHHDARHQIFQRYGLPCVCGKLLASAWHAGMHVLKGCPGRPQTQLQWLQTVIFPQYREVQCEIMTRDGVQWQCETGDGTMMRDANGNEVTSAPSDGGPSTQNPRPSVWGSRKPSRSIQDDDVTGETTETSRDIVKRVAAVLAREPTGPLHVLFARRSEMTMTEGWSADVLSTAIAYANRFDITTIVRFQQSLSSFKTPLLPVSTAHIAFCQTYSELHTDAKDKNVSWQGVLGPAFLIGVWAPRRPQDRVLILCADTWCAVPLVARFAAAVDFRFHFMISIEELKAADRSLATRFQAEMEHDKRAIRVDSNRSANDYIMRFRSYDVAKAFAEMQDDALALLWLEYMALKQSRKDQLGVRQGRQTDKRRKTKYEEVMGEYRDSMEDNQDTVKEEIRALFANE